MDFTEYFYTIVKQIPSGRVSTYGALARALGDIRASRAVGRMLNRNPYAPVVPCHRVVMGDGSLGGFGTGVPEKIRRLAKEGVYVSDNKVVDFKDIFFDDFLSDNPLGEMREEQKRLKRKVVLKDSFSEIETVAGLDVAYNTKGFGACTVFDYGKMKVIKEITLSSEVDIPYIPTYLAFRELPVIERMWKKIQKKPDVLLIDGNGVLHPLGLGIASHVGVKLNIPTIGVAKSLLCGQLKKENLEAGKHSEVEHEGKVIGYALRSSPKAKKLIYISPGHKVSFDTALEIVERSCRYKIPEPIRAAHRMANEARDAARM
ncbi:MAG: endonuclease V [Thermoplasmata archaeon]|nr:MAG: endonuclease V [Thermoplasmata archaeon]